MFFFVRGDSFCVEDVQFGQWKFTDGKGWRSDSGIAARCLDEPATEPECLYNDNTDFDGEDLPDVFGGGGVETDPRSSSECIDLCEKTAGCNYWTWITNGGQNYAIT